MMKRHSIFILCFSLAAMLCVSVAAIGKKPRKPRAKQETVDTISVEKLSYAMGKIQSQGLKTYMAQRMGVDTTYLADFLQGFQQKQLTEKELRLKARLAGTEIRAQVEQEILPAANKQLAESLDSLVSAQFVQGFQDGITGAGDGLSIDSTRQLVQKQLDYYHRTRMEKLYGENKKQGEEFLKKNARKDSVKVTPSGLQYKVLTEGKGALPTDSCRVKVNYEGRLVDGTVFDSSYRRGKPVTFPVNQIIRGWAEALVMMPVGSKWEVYVPQELAYGDREQKGIPPFSCLIFTIELLDILK